MRPYDKYLQTSSQAHMAYDFAKKCTVNQNPNIPIITFCHTRSCNATNRNTNSIVYA